MDGDFVYEERYSSKSDNAVPELPISEGIPVKAFSLYVYREIILLTAMYTHYSVPVSVCLCVSLCVCITAIHWFVFDISLFQTGRL